MQPDTESAVGVRETLEGLLDAGEVAESIGTGDFKRFLDRLPVGIAISKLIGNSERVVYVNAAFESLTGVPAALLLQRSWPALDALRSEGKTPTSLGEAVVTGEDDLGVFRKPNGGLLEASVTGVEQDGGGPGFRLLALADISGRERTLRSEFEKHLRDKDVLLKELQHRVKNSLQIITALIRLEARNAREGRAVNFDSIAGRIEALSLLYRALSESTSETVLDLGSYLSQIASACQRSHATEHVRFHLKVDNCPVSINVAMPTGLIINEVITNALKHAFAGREGGTLTLHCLRDDDVCRVLVADDGVGLPPGVGWPPEGKISALIAQSLRENAGADVRVDSRPDGGTRISFDVPLRLEAVIEPVRPYETRARVERGEGASLTGA